MAKKVNIIIGSAMTECVNRGCEALAYSLLYLLGSYFKKRGVEYSLTLTGSGLVDDGEHELLLDGTIVRYSANSNLVYPFPGFHKWFFFLKLFFKSGHQIAARQRLLRETDFIFDIGGGDSFADIYGSKRFKGVNCIYELARYYHKPYCILPQTIGPFNDPDVRQEAAKTISEAGLVMARDKQSYDCARQLAPQQRNLFEYIDVAFFLPFSRRRFADEFIHVGLNVSALLCHGGYTKDNQFGLIVDYQKIVHSILDYFLSIPNVCVHLVPHVNGNFRDVENDYGVSIDLRQEYAHSRLIISDFFLNPIEAKSYIAGLDFFMGSRMHSTIAAFSSNVPVVPMSYSRKFNGLFEDTLHYNYVADMKESTPDAIINKIKLAFNCRDNLKSLERQQMRTTVAEAGRRIEKDLCSFMGL